MAKSIDPKVPAEMLPDDGMPPAVGSAQFAAEQDPVVAAELAGGTSGIPADDDLLAVVTSVSTDTLSGIDQTLDHLTTSVDLFDVPPLDVDTA